MHEVVNLILASGNSGVSTVKACTRVAELVQAEVGLCRCMQEKYSRCRVKQAGTVWNTESLFFKPCYFPGAPPLLLW